MSPVVRALLWLGVEDYTGLWEAVAEVRAANRLLGSRQARRQTAKLLSDLARRGWIELYICVEPLDDAISQVPAEQVDEVLEREDSWEPPIESGSKSVRFATTERGESAYEESARSTHDGETEDEP